MSNTIMHSIDASVVENNENYICKKYTFNNNEYEIIKYNKNKLKDYENTNIELFNEMSKFRSVIIRNNKVVVYSPSKSANYNRFIDLNKNSLESCWCEEFIDGTMINVFYDNINNQWEIATKSSIGGNMLFFNDIKNYRYFFNETPDENNNVYTYSYSNDITFRSMFFEACNYCNFNLNTLDRNYSYTFVLQHPYNRIVVPITYPSIFLVKMYSIDNTNYPKVNITEIDISSFVNSVPYIFLDTKVSFTNKYPITNLESLNAYSLGNISFDCVGCMLYDSNGNRSKIRNQNYEIVRKLRGNQPKLQYQYLYLKQNNKINDFLLYYPEHMIIFKKFKLIVFTYTQELFMNYINCFINKEKPLKEYDFRFKTHMYHIHQKYISELKPKNKYVDKKIVIDYFNALHPAQQMFVLNCNNYKNKTDKAINTENTDNITTEGMQEEYCEINLD